MALDENMTQNEQAQLTSEDGRLIWASHFYKLDGYGQLH